MNAQPSHRFRRLKIAGALLLAIVTLPAVVMMLLGTLDKGRR